jgi:hypothetical protein
MMPIMVKTDGNSIFWVSFLDIDQLNLDVFINLFHLTNGHKKKPFVKGFG